MALQVPDRLADAITGMDIRVVDDTAFCDGSDAVGGVELARITLMLAEPNRVRVSPGVRVFELMAFEGPALIARGCARATLDAGSRTSVTLRLVEYGLDCGPEVCDGSDNDCDGVIDEHCPCTPGDRVPCFGGTAEQRGVGECSDGMMTCADTGDGTGAFGECEGDRTPEDEVCDGAMLDENCDDMPNLGCTCVDVESEECGTNEGPCVAGVHTCDEGQWGDCIGEVPPELEVCNNVDDDCDGTIDEMVTQVCGSDQGACQTGVQTCSAGVFGECVGEIVPIAETCNDIDDNCDGVVDNDLTRVCGSDTGACQTGIETCAAGEWGACVGEIESTTEICNNIDDDCDGPRDESLMRVCGSDTGACQTGIETCSSGAWGTCAGEISAATELCNNVDDDCDGLIDESLTDVCGSSVGACTTGITTCSAGVWGTCVGQIVAIDETCNNSDDDCDGGVDENLTRLCGTDVGACSTGIETCAAGAYGACVGEVSSGTEDCDNVDDDCDGTTDEGVTRPCVLQTCYAGFEACTAGAFGSCQGPLPPMVTVFGGPYMRGCNEPEDSECEADEYPYASVTVNEFDIDDTEVSQIAYSLCVDDGACTAPAAGFNPSGTPCLPVTYVSWSQARDYCLWMGKDLPTEAQWEKAARGTDERLYPWGDEDPDCTRAQFKDCSGGAAPIASYPAGMSPYGGMDMAGNVLEWVRDWYNGTYYQLAASRSNPTGPATGGAKVFRGGGYNHPRASPPATLRASDRFVDSPAVQYADLGFRCVGAP